MLTFKQHQAIIELIKPTRKTFTEIARIIGVSPRTLYNWRKQKEFFQAYEEAFNGLKRNVESSAELPIQLEAIGDGKNYKAKVSNQVDFVKTLKELLELHIILIKQQDNYETELDDLYRNAIKLSTNLTKIKEEIEYIKTNFFKD